MTVQLHADIQWQSTIYKGTDGLCGVMHVWHATNEAINSNGLLYVPGMKAFPQSHVNLLSSSQAVWDYKIKMVHVYARPAMQ